MPPLGGLAAAGVGLGIVAGMFAQSLSDSDGEYESGPLRVTARATVPFWLSPTRLRIGSADAAVAFRGGFLGVHLVHIRQIALGFRYAPAATLVKFFGSAKSKADVSAWAEFLDQLVEPVGRARRARAVQNLRNVQPRSEARPIPVAKTAHRWGWVLGAVMEVLEFAGGPLRAREIHVAAEKLLGEPVAWSSVKNSLAEGVRRTPPRFERIGRGRYRLASDHRTIGV